MMASWWRRDENGDDDDDGCEKDVKENEGGKGELQEDGKEDTKESSNLSIMID